MAPWAWVALALATAYVALVATLCSWAGGRRRVTSPGSFPTASSWSGVWRAIGACRDAGRWALGALLLYLLLPFDLVPDFLPIAGQLDDAVLVVAVLRGVLRAAGPAVVAEHWLGSQTALAILTRMLETPLRWSHEHR